MHSERMVTALTFSLARAVCERAPRLLRDLCNTMMQYTFTNTPSWLVSFTPKCNLHPKVTVACFLFSSMINVYLFLSRRKKYMIVVFGSFLSVLSVNRFGMFWICCVNKHKNAWTLTSPTKGIVIYNTLYPQVCFFLVCFGTWNWAIGEYLAVLSTWDGMANSVSHGNTKQLWASVRSCIQKRPDNAFLQVCSRGRWDSMSSRKDVIGWFHVSEEACVGPHPRMVPVICSRRDCCLVGTGRWNHWPLSIQINYIKLKRFFLWYKNSLARGFFIV